MFYKTYIIIIFSVYFILLFLTKIKINLYYYVINKKIISYLIIATMIKIVFKTILKIYLLYIFYKLKIIKITNHNL